ncbi:MAG: glycosyltransferase family 2 protein [Anaerolineaceae bacterium]|nr:glycosyltransferase family 2 protein [Anaerolineaceae bacterium]
MSDSFHKIKGGVSAFFPAYNDAGTIASMVDSVMVALPQITDDFEVIVVNDGSKDYTQRVLLDLQKRYPQLRIVLHLVNMGYGAALRDGFAAARKEWVFYTDGDGQYNPLELVNLAQALEPGIDVVNGYKLTRSDPLNRKIIGRLYHYFVKFAFGFHSRDVDCDFRLIRRELFDHVKLESNTGTICLEMVKKFQDAGYQFKQVPVHHYSRSYGKSQFFNFRHLWNTFKQLNQLWWQLKIKKNKSFKV